MKDESVTDASLRQFLLGKMNEDERERIESLFLTDPIMRERVLAVEQDLIEDYLEDSLSVSDREEFVLRYAQTVEQRRKLRITKSIKEWAIAEDLGRTAAERGPTSISMWSRIRGRLGLRPSWVVPIAAVIILAIVFALIWLNRWNGQRRQFAIEQEVARLNSPEGLREYPPQRPPLSLNPLLLRSGQSPPEVKLNSGAAVELQLVLMQRERYPTYQAVVLRHDGAAAFTVPNLHAENDGKTIPLRLPSHLLQRGLYLIKLTGIAEDSSTQSSAEYQLSIID